MVRCVQNHHRLQDPGGDLSQYVCGTCQSPLERVEEGEQGAAILGAGVGGALGAAMGGPIGAAIGAGIGALVGAATGSKKS